MTNKLPVVGNRYRRLHCGNEYELVSFCERRNSYFLKAITGIDKGAVFEFSSYFAEKHFKELPEDKAETKPETQSHISQLSPEVKEAMEELDKELDHWMPTEDKEEYQLTSKVEKLLNALDKQFMSKEEDKIDTRQERVDSVKVNETNKSVDVKEEEVKENILTAKDKKSNVIEFDYIKTQAEEVADNKIEAKEESIWKPVSELPEDGCEKLLIKLNGTVQIANHTFYDDERIDELYITDGWGKDKIECTEYPSEEVESFCTLTDFINDYEKLKERVKKLEEK